MIDKDEWTERLASSAKELVRARVQHSALEQHYQRVVNASATAGPVASAQLPVASDAVEDLAALEALLDEARGEHNAALFRRNVITTLHHRKDASEASESVTQPDVSG